MAHSLEYKLNHDKNALKAKFEAESYIKKHHEYPLKNFADLKNGIKNYAKSLN